MQGIPNNPYASSRYVKLKEGTIRLRLFDFIDGWEYWTDANGKVVPRGGRAGEGGKPKRVAQTDLETLPIEARNAANYFRAYKVFNYETKRTEILQLKQRTILEPLIAYFYDEDWGGGKTLSTFDITITRTGEGLETTYQVTPKPKSVFQHKLSAIDLDALYRGDDPFTATVAEDIEEDLDSQGIDEAMPEMEDLFTEEE